MGKQCIQAMEYWLIFFSLDNSQTVCKNAVKLRKKLLLKNLKTKEIFYTFFHSEDDTRGRKEGNRILEKADTGETR